MEWEVDTFQLTGTERHELAEQIQTTPGTNEFEGYCSNLGENSVSIWSNSKGNSEK